MYNRLGFGFLEKVYEKAMMIELSAAGLGACNQYPVSVHYRDHLVGDYFADIVVEGTVVLEL